MEKNKPTSTDDSAKDSDYNGGIPSPLLAVKWGVITFCIVLLTPVFYYLGFLNSYLSFLVPILVFGSIFLLLDVVMSNHDTHD